MSITLWKLSAWAMIGGVTSSAISSHLFTQWLRETQEDESIPFQIEANPLIFTVGAVAGVTFKLLGIPTIQFLANRTFTIGATAYHQRQVIYDATIRSARSINLWKLGAWAMIGGVTSSAIGSHLFTQWLRETHPDESIPFKIEPDPLVFTLGAVAGAAFKLLGIPAIQFLAKTTFTIGATAYHQRHVVYDTTKWFFTG